MKTSRYYLGHVAVMRDQYRRPVMIGIMVRRTEHGVILYNPGIREWCFAPWRSLDPPQGRKWPRGEEEA